MKSMPLFYYPTQVVWVDDDELFLQSGSERYKNIFNIKTFTSPQECIEALNNPATSASLPLLAGSSEHENYDLIDHMPVDINLDSIYALKNNDKRFQDVSVIIVDYNMPGKTGIELCYELRDLPIKKILLTGEATHRLAIEAFNNGIIDCFIRKDDPMLSAELTGYIQKLQHQYFVDLSRPLLSHLEVDYKLPQSDPQFFDFFEVWIKENKIREYYLVDKNGTLLTKNQDNEVKYFIAHTDRSLDVFSNLYVEDRDVSGFVDAVNQRKKIPFFGFKSESWHYEFNQWKNHFYSPNRFDGREKYYWTVVSE